MKIVTVKLEAVIQRRTDNATVKRKETNDSRENTQQQTKIRIEQHELN